MTLLIRWDAADTVYISGPPGDRYVHFPVEIASTTDASGNVSVSAHDPSNNVIVEQTYAGVPLGPNYVKFSPAILVPDSYFAKTESWTLKVLLYTTSIPITTPRLVTKTISNTGTGSGERNWLFVALGAGLLLLALGGKRMLR